MAYPRRCGEHGVSLADIMVKKGLPPQVRGTPVNPRYEEPAVGLTPAGAGNTRLANIATLPARGLPPQVRGTQPDTSASVWVSGLTPAGAGNTFIGMI